MPVAKRMIPKCKAEIISNLSKGYNKKTNEQYLIELSAKNHLLIHLEEYRGTLVGIQHICKTCGYIYITTPSNALQGKLCPKCAGNIQYTDEEYEQLLSKCNPHIHLDDHYINAKTQIWHWCDLHNIRYKTSPASTLQGSGCPQCGLNKSRQARSKTHEQYVLELLNKNSNIIVLEQYINSATPIMHRCLICLYEWNARPGNILFGAGCPQCAGNIKYTNNDYIQMIAEANPNIISLEEYNGMNNKILHRCLKHMMDWYTRPVCVLRGNGCPECCKDKIYKANTKTQEEYIDDLKQVHKDNIIVLEQYINANKPILHKCMKCQNEWKCAPANLLSGHGCPRCNISIGERKISNLLDLYGISYIPQYKFDDCRDIIPLPFDFYLIDYNLCIEYDGEQHFRPIDFFGGEKAFEDRKKKDKIKTDYCQNNNIPLLRIRYDEDIETILNNYFTHLIQ